MNTCIHCSHQWLSRSLTRSAVCPGCRRPDWDGKVIVKRNIMFADRPKIDAMLKEGHTEAKIASVLGYEQMSIARYVTGSATEARRMTQRKVRDAGLEAESRRIENNVKRMPYRIMRAIWDRASFTYHTDKPTIQYVIQHQAELEAEYGPKKPVVSVKPAAKKSAAKKGAARK